MPESDAGSVPPVCLEGRIRAKHELSLSEAGVSVKATILF